MHAHTGAHTHMHACMHISHTCTRGVGRRRPARAAASLAGPQRSVVGDFVGDTVRLPLASPCVWPDSSIRCGVLRIALRRPETPQRAPLGGPVRWSRGPHDHGETAPAVTCPRSGTHPRPSAVSRGSRPAALNVCPTNAANKMVPVFIPRLLQRNWF